MQLMGADHIVELIRVYACRIDNAAGGKVTLCGMDQITLSRPGNVGNLCVEMEIHAVHIRIFRQGNRHFKRTDDTACGSIEHGLYIR